MQLKIKSSQAWLAAVLSDFDRFLQDHASCEKKASGMALSFISHYPDKPELIKAMMDLALEELNHFKQVYAIMEKQGIELAADVKDPYINQLKQLIGQGREQYLIDRLLVAAIVERRGHERFGLIAQALPEGKLKRFYQVITRSEAKHYELFLNLAHQYAQRVDVTSRLEQLLIAEAAIIEQLPALPQLH
ncbi:tRNA-(ms[2]io[6]A)-hydroxylase [Kangiella sp. TOML190]|uniref:tRNA-(ms[2]io[6]A)-hydroxylase n=1 Tax=Kangiella sp. TOML190 TaxID=2931351 RepID=UPI00203DAE50|nr:tRNA-(ms[2]io[6]A)-hydroxylase [Kangiella sp. TOML190]